MNNTPPKNKKLKKLTSAIFWAALLLGLTMPFGIYIGLQQNLPILAGICFGLLTFSMGLTAWKG